MTNVSETVVGQIAAAYFANNTVKTDELTTVILNIRKGLTQDLDADEEALSPFEPVAELKTKAEIQRSITPDALYSFIDNKPYKTLRRHLKLHGLDDRAYRERYGLPGNYPMVAPNYSAQRSDLARALGLGNPGGKAVPGHTASKQQKPRAAA